MHSSYEAGINPGLIAQEHNNLENAIIQPVKYNRHHYLSSRDPRDMEELEKAGITDDFTMGYAYVAGFRLGTTRPVRRIDPYTGIVNSLKLHSISNGLYAERTKIHEYDLSGGRSLLPRPDRKS